MNFFKRQTDKLKKAQWADKQAGLIARFETASESYSKAIVWAVLLGIIGGKISIADCIFRIGAMLLLPYLIAADLAPTLVRDSDPLYFCDGVGGILEITMKREIYTRCVYGLAAGFLILYFAKAILLPESGFWW